MRETGRGHIYEIEREREESGGGGVLQHKNDCACQFECYQIKHLLNNYVSIIGILFNIRIDEADIIHLNCSKLTQFMDEKN